MIFLNLRTRITPALSLKISNRFYRPNKPELLNLAVNLSCVLSPKIAVKNKGHISSISKAVELRT